MQDLTDEQKAAVLLQGRGQQSGILGGKGLSKDVINLALVMGGLRSLGPTSAEKGFTTNFAQGASEGLQLGAAFQPKPPLFPAGQTEFEKGVGQAGAKIFVKTQADAKAGVDTLQNYGKIQQLGSLLDEGKFGQFAGLRQEINQTLDVFGIADLDAEQDINLTTILKLQGEVAARGLSVFPGAISDGERAFIVGITPGNIEDKKESFQFAVSLAANEAKGKILDGQAATKYAAFPGANFVNAITVDGKGTKASFEDYRQVYRTSQGWKALPKESADILRATDEQYRNPNNYVYDKNTDSYAYFHKGKVVEFMSLPREEYKRMIGQ
tara:strand:- start:956 stop:1930 length:975 start_codon:yes stop_codon:yes gene_type:complete